MYLYFLVSYVAYFEVSPIVVDVLPLLFFKNVNVDEKDYRFNLTNLIIKSVSSGAKPLNC